MFSMAEKENLVLPARLKCQERGGTMILSLNLFPCIFELLGIESRTLYMLAMCFVSNLHHLLEEYN